MEFTKEQLFFNGDVNAPVWENRKRECQGGIAIARQEILLEEELVIDFAINAPNY